jgi:hypothetical protein
MVYRVTFGWGVKKMKRKVPGWVVKGKMSVNGSVVSNDSVDVKEMMEVLDAPIAPTKAKGKRVLKSKATPMTPLAIVPVAVVAPVEETLDTEEAIETDTTPEEEINYKELYEALSVKYEALLAKTTKAKNENSPDIVEGIHMRMVGGVKTKTRYIFPYQADGGKSIVKEMKDGQKCIGVSTTQKNNSKGSCKVADYDLIWVNSKIVKDTKTGKAYPHKDGKFAVMNEEDMTSFNVRMMIVAE